MSDAAYAAADRQRAKVMVGSSLGALVALDVARRGVTLPLVLIAPALAFGRRWSVRLSRGASGHEVMHYGDGARRVIHHAFFEEMSAVDVDTAPPPVPVTLIMGREDESVPYGTVRSIWEGWKPELLPGSEMITIEGGDHGLLEHVDVIESAILKALNLSRGR